MDKDGNCNIQEKPPPSPEDVGDMDGAFKMSDPEATREAELAKRYDKMSLVQKFSMEIIFMFFIFSSMIITIPQTQVFLTKACELNLHYDKSICDNINDKTNEKYYAAAARITKTYGLIKDIVTTVPGAISSVIAGQYMTRYGAKVPLVLALIGSVATSLGDLYTFYDMKSPLYVNTLTAIPQAVTGGIVIFMTAIFSNVTAMCPSEKRKGRFLMIQFFMFLPIVIAVSISGYIKERLGVLALASVVGGGYAITLGLLLFIYQDAGISDGAKQDSFRDAWKHSTSVKTFKRSFSYLTRSRPGHARAQILCMFGCLMSGIIAFTGTSDLDQIYTTNSFSWGIGYYGMIKAVLMVITFVLAVPSMLILTKVFKFSDPMLAAIGFASFALKSSLMCFFFLGKFMFFLAPIVGLPFLVGLTAIRSHLSRLLESHEVAVIFSLTSACERLVPVIADIGVTAIYNATNDFFPGLVYLVQGSLFLIPFTVSIACFRWTKIDGYPDYERLNEDAEPTEESQNID